MSIVSEAARRGLSFALPRVGRAPVVTATVWAATAAATVAGNLSPAVLDALMRRPGMLAAGEWWRLVTPLLVHDKGWSQTAINLAGLAVVGAAVERAYGGRRWLALYLVAGAVGQAAAHLWYPVGAGASTGIAGLSGALLVWLLARRTPVPRLAPFFSVFLTAALVGRYLVNLGFPGGEIGGAVACCTLLGVLLQWRAKRNTPRDTPAYFLGVAGLLGAMTLTVLRDIHGPSLLVAVCLAVLMLRYGGRTPTAEEMSLHTASEGGISPR